MSSFNTTSLDSLIKLLPDLRADLRKILLNFPTENYPLDKFYLIGIIERYWINFEAIELLLRNLKDSFHLEHAIGLILRNSIHDTINILYLSSFYFDNKTQSSNLHDEVFILCADQVASTIDYIESLEQSKIVEDKKINEAIESILKNFNYFFRDGEDEKIKKRLIERQFPSVKKKIAKISSVPHLKSLSKIYDLYQLYSKYEHYGIITHQIQRMNPNDLFLNIPASIHYMVKGISSTLILMKTREDDYLKEIDIITKYDDLIAQI